MQALGTQKTLNQNQSPTGTQLRDKQFQLDSYNYILPEENIAQEPARQRDQSRLLVIDCLDDQIHHSSFVNITNYLRPGDLLVVNNSKVFPARLYGQKATGGKVEMLLLHFPVAVQAEPTETTWKSCEALALLRSSKRPRLESTLSFGEKLTVTVKKFLKDGKVEVLLRYDSADNTTLDQVLSEYGQMPLPPYIKREHGSSENDTERYQTKYAKQLGSVAAPTAGLHFSDELLQAIDEMNISIATVTLHVGYGTFAPVRTDDIREHEIHSEYIEIPEETANSINHTKEKGGRIWAIGTTTARTLEFAASDRGRVEAQKGLCDLFIYPGYSFKIIDNLITNFHLPRSSLLFLVSALAGKDRILSSYKTAVSKQYRFYSYGDAMAIITKK